MITNSPRRKHTRYELEQRKSFALGVHFTRKDKVTPLDVTGCQLHLTVKQPQRMGGDVEINVDAEILNGPMGLFQFELHGEDLDLEAIDYDFAMTLTTALGYSVLVQKGTWSMQTNVDDSGLDDDYVGINPSSNIAVSVEQNNILEVVVTNVDGLSILVQALLDEAYAAMATINARITALEEDVVLSENVRNILRVTQAEYDAIVVKSASTLYVIVD